MRTPVFLLLLLAAGCARPIRFATFNTALSKAAPGALLATMRTPDDPQARAVAEIIQRVRPDVLLLQEFDHGGEYDPDGQALDLFQRNYLGIAQNGGEPIRYAHAYLAPSNTGLPTGVDLNGDGLVAPCPGAEIGSDAYAADCHGWGRFPGQYAFVILSNYPIDWPNIRTFQTMLWKDLPGNHLPADYYSETARDVLRLSSKNHVDVPILIAGRAVHVLAAHPTPPVEVGGGGERNGPNTRRNYDEIKLLADGIPYHFEGLRHPPGGKTVRNPPDPTVVVMGDLSADPTGGGFVPSDEPRLPEIYRHGRRQLWLNPSELQFPTATDAILRHPRIDSGLIPERVRGGADLPLVQKQSVGDDLSLAAETTDRKGSRLQSTPRRTDYVLPSIDLKVVGGGVFWPTPGRPLMGIPLATVERASDHRLVWVDVRPR